MTLHGAEQLTAGKTWRLIGIVGLSLVLNISSGWGGERSRSAAETHDEFGPAPENYSELFKDFPAQPSREEFPSYRNSIRTPARVPVPSATPWRTPPVPQRTVEDPTLEQKITRRYQDPRVIRVLTELTSQTGEAFFKEISQMIDARHIEPTSYAQRMDAGFDHLRHAVANPAFQQAAGIRPSAGEVRGLQGQLATLQQELRVRNQADSINVIRQVGRMAQQSVGLNPGAVCFEFVYASLDTLDKFSMLLPPEKTGQVSVGLNENIVGIGVEVEADPKGLKIVKAFPGGPAAEATLRKGDLITAVNNRQLAGMELSNAVDMITGRAGSAVKLGLRRDNMVADLTLVRRQVEISSISEVRMLDESSHIGYIKLDQFAESSSKELDTALWNLHNAGMESLVFDLRGNPGGYLTTAIEISDRFLPAGTIVSTRGRTSDDNMQETAKFAQTWKIPLVVLIDHQSASASEIFAAAIQENGRGLVVGETSYGKGTVQTLFPLNSVTAGLRLTTAKFYSPDGREMAGEGVRPDIKVETGSNNDDAAMLQAALEAARDPRLQTMADRLKRPAGRTGLRTFQVSTAMRN